jgi:outer membrane biosynthesis protein TonB
MFAAFSRIRLALLVFAGALAVASVAAISARAVAATQQQQPASAPTPETQSAQQPAASQPAQPSTAQPADAQPSGPQTPAAPAQTESAQAPARPTEQPTPAKPQPDTHAASPKTPEAGGITEDDLRTMLVGKQLFLRSGYLDNALSFNEHGVLVGHSAQGSYTLCEIQIDKVHLSRHKVELDGQRFGLHFLGAMPYEDPTKAVDRVNITPKKKVVRITIDREIVVKPKVKKEKNKAAAKTAAGSPAATPAAAVPSPAPPQSPTPPDSSAAPAATDEAAASSEAHAEIAAAPPEERPADEKSVTTTTSPAHATKVLKDALDNIFAQGFDSRLMASMPDFWKLYYEAAANKTDYRPNDPAVLRENLVDKKAQLVNTFEPQSNQFAQDHGVAGMSLYHVVVGADGKPADIAVARPIGFGLDENAVESIRKATFSPAMKDGKPVPVLLNLVVEFRIYSKRTDVVAKQAPQSTGPTLPGPYSVEHK